MSIPNEFLRQDKIRGIVKIKNLQTDEIYLLKTEDAVKSYKNERFKLDLSIHPCRKLQKAYTDLGLELFLIDIDAEACKDEDLSMLLESRKQHYIKEGLSLYND